MLTRFYRNFFSVDDHKVFYREGPWKGCCEARKYHAYVPRFICHCIIHLHPCRYGKTDIQAVWYPQRVCCGGTSWPPLQGLVHRHGVCFSFSNSHHHLTCISHNVTVVERRRPLLLNRMQIGPNSREGFSLGGEKKKRYLHQLTLISLSPTSAIFMPVYVYSIHMPLHTIPNLGSVSQCHLASKTRFPQHRRYASL